MPISLIIVDYSSRLKQVYTNSLGVAKYQERGRLANCASTMLDRCEVLSPFASDNRRIDDSARRGLWRIVFLKCTESATNSRAMRECSYYLLMAGPSSGAKLANTRTS